MTTPKSKKYCATVTQIILIPILFLVTINKAGAANPINKATKNLFSTILASGNNVKPQADTGKVYLAVSNPPTFNGDIVAFDSFLQKNIKYPETAKANNIQGKVFIKFIVEKDGNLTAIQAVRGSDVLIAEAIRVIKLSPKWNPGSQDGKAVRVLYTVPILFEDGSARVIPPPTN